ncbi:hypothetical protein MCP_1921 [Methanocella paludicola SANAE]|uniref:Uncharacterized protein n=1 Tax=Methanocella paludicola (strain DSM 17711 / JCM 13418 / NBRC 101707 / SANAE) TaxID=304371 RepID=D1YZX1_METPS|nr:DUF5788 family protein [Methanocella paludicola]BAI61993.1 hypothetical protein MCP_1921 [Methanocella paludicola SANAE]
MNENVPNSCPLNYAGIPSGGKLTDEERKHLEAKLSRLLEWVGAWVPDEIVLEGKKLPLHEIIWNIVKKDKLTDSELELLLSLEKKLNEKYRQDLANIKYRDTTEDQAIKDFCEAIGLLRALVTLRDIEKKEEKKEEKDDVILKMRENSKEQALYWMGFLKRFNVL